MERIFRGYPQVLAAAEHREPAPYMVYRKENQVPELRSQRQRVQAELEYFKGMYPQQVRSLQALVDEASDRLDYEGSPMYDEYPDREFIYHVRDTVSQSAAGNGLTPDPALTQLLVVNEMCRRRLVKRVSGGGVQGQQENM